MIFEGLEVDGPKFSKFSKDCAVAEGGPATGCAMWYWPWEESFVVELRGGGLDGNGDGPVSGAGWPMLEERGGAGELREFGLRLANRACKSLADIISVDSRLASNCTAFGALKGK